MHSNDVLPGPSGKIRLLILGEDSIFRTGLIAILQSNPDIRILAVVPSAKEAMETYQTILADVVFLDDLLPGITAPEFISTLLNVRPSNVIVVSAVETSEDIHKCLIAGAKSYLPKNAHPDELLVAIREVQNGNTYFSPSVANKLAERLSCEALTSRELQIAELVAAGSTNRQIARKLYLAEATVKVHLTSIFSKLRVSNRNQAILTMFRHGIVHFHSRQTQRNPISSVPTSR
jgi:two-component system NarL family response regulator